MHVPGREKSPFSTLFITEVAKGLWMRHEHMQVAKLLDYAKRLGVGAVTRRLGYLLELYRITSENELEN